MSENTNENNDDPVTPDADISVLDESEIESEIVTEASEVTDAEFVEQPAAPGKGGSVVSWLALLLATIALAGAALIYLGGGDDAVTEQAQAEIESLQAAIRASRESMTTLEQSVSALSTLDGTRSAEMASLDRQFQDRLRQMESLPGRIAGVESTLSALQGVSTGARDAWLLAETEYYMQIANAQLQLAGNPHLAKLALSLADERLLQLANPGLVQARRALSDELRALEAMQKPDTEGITLTLASLAGAVDSLPLRTDRVVAPAPDHFVDPELTGVDRAMATLRKTLGNVVTVRRTDEAVQPMIAPEAQYFLRANLALQFQAARLAVLQGEEAIFEQSLDDASAWLEKYYDTGDAAVQNAQQNVASIRGSAFNVSKPDISESLRLIRQFNALSGMEPDLQTPEIEETDVQPDLQPELQPELQPAESQPSDSESEPQQ